MYISPLLVSHSAFEPTSSHVRGAFVGVVTSIVVGSVGAVVVGSVEAVVVGSVEAAEVRWVAIPDVASGTC